MIWNEKAFNKDDDDGFFLERRTNLSVSGHPVYKEKGELRLEPCSAGIDFYAGLVEKSQHTSPVDEPSME